ncbi:primosomal protein N' [Alicyclobacillus mengziensis]|uniref:Replication restart protein PriA n=1 Tax=Alicyclobacillus mengziensis TaxID=2931921 RepID=A0A9X7Z8D2_9BACL|nr:primosomal protein N' [Alicyclobacillus mengziensis]QSO49502.1 primosomal protein N' [Alicyclobacillus mengziensis]
MKPTLIAKVVVDVRTKALNRPFDYVVPEGVKADTGYRVLVSFGRQLTQGYVVGFEAPPQTEREDRKLKPILSVLDDQPILSAELLAMCNWLTDRYVCTMLEAIQSVLPGAFRTVTRDKYVCTQKALHQWLRDEREATAGDSDEGDGDGGDGDGGDSDAEVNDNTGLHDANALPAAILQLLRTLGRKPLSAEQLIARLGPEVMLQLPQAISLGLVTEVFTQRDKVNDRFEAFLTTDLSSEQLAAEVLRRERRAPKQYRLLQRLLQSGLAERPVSVSALGVRPSDAAVQALIHSGVLGMTQEQVFRDEAWLSQLALASGGKGAKRELTDWQKRALGVITRSLDTKQKQVVVLHGVTGSGKTEVYMQAIDACLTVGRSAIVLVPEISLTPQMVERFTSRFGQTVAVMHSALSAGERKDGWVRVLQGLARVVIGARSAVFAPVVNLGLVVVDEEHEPSYKQEETPFYDAREVAEWRANYHGTVVVYGSATPSLEAMAKVESGRALLTTLPERINQSPMPAVEVVDMREELKSGNRSLFSRALQSGLESCMEAGHQAIVFLNRRGYSAFVLCRNCGERIQCPNCDISLTLHRGQSGDWLSCHYCQYRADVPDTCPACGEQAMRPFGIGTEQVEEHLHRNWPHWRILRMDVDTTRRKGSHHELIHRFERGDADILLGTQMVAKGLDFPNVAFVGVISADTMLAVPDYRANERTFNLLTQVLGRAGRAETTGLTVIQTYRPDHYAVLAAAHHDYGSFYRREKELREAFDYPPYQELSLFLATHAQVNIAKGAAARFERELKRRLSPADATVLSASPSGIGRLENRFRYQVVVKYSQWETVKSSLQEAYAIVSDKMVRLGGTCVLDVNAGRM